MPATRSPTGQYVRTRRPGRGQRVLQVVAEAAQHLELEVVDPERVGVGERRGRSSAGCGEAIAGRTQRHARRAAARQRSNWRSQSRRSVKTGGAQPCWRASTTSWSQ